jgi:hypothetical protein
MTSPRTEIDARPDQAEKPPRTTLSVTQVVAGALAAVSAAVAASFLGVAGTVIGAALVSVVSTVGSALYSASLNRTTERLRRTRETPADDTATRVLPAHLDPRATPAPRRRIRWPRLAVYAAGVFVVAMAIVTGIELVGQKPVSALVGGDDRPSSSTTIGELSTASSGSDVPPSDTDPADPTTEAPATDEPAGDAPTTEAPTTEAPATPGDDGTDAPDTDTPDTDTPATGTPAPETPAGGGEGDGGSDDTGETAPAEPSAPAPQEGTGTGPGATPGA